jgi:hypothetical protein
VHDVVGDEVSRRGEEDFDAVQVVGDGVTDEFFGGEEGGTGVEAEGTMEVDFEGPGAGERRVGVTDNMFYGMAGLGGVAEGSEDGDGGGELVREDEEIDVGEVAGAEVRVYTGEDVREAFEGDGLDAGVVEGGGKFVSLR